MAGHFINSIFRRLAPGFLFACLAQIAGAQLPPLTVKVELVSSTSNKRNPAGRLSDASDVVVWLVPENRSTEIPKANPSGRVSQMVQRNKEFEPHVLAIRAGTAVQFPNKDHFLHNVFSLYEGKRFDLGFYEAGSAKSVQFDRAGVSFLFCHIHPEMAAAVVAVDTPYFAVTDKNGQAVIAGVPDGGYTLHVWSERSLAEELKKSERTILISQENRNLGPIRIVLNPDFTLVHKNKYGQDYVTPPSVDYSRP